MKNNKSEYRNKLCLFGDWYPQSQLTVKGYIATSNDYITVCALRSFCTFQTNSTCSIA